MNTNLPQRPAFETAAKLVCRSTRGQYPKALCQSTILGQRTSGAGQRLLGDLSMCFGTVVSIANDQDAAIRMAEDVA